MIRQRSWEAPTPLFSLALTYRAPKRPLTRILCFGLLLTEGIKSVSWTESLKRIWGDPVWSKVISSAIIGLFVLLGSYWLGVWPSIKTYVQSLMGYALKDSSIPNWIILIGIISFFFSVGVILKRLWRRFSPPDWKDYTSDELLGINWRWRWENNRIAGLIAYCPTCDMEVHGYTSEYDEYQTDFYCDKCDRALQTLKMEPHVIADRSCEKSKEKSERENGRQLSRHGPT